MNGCGEEDIAVGKQIWIAVIIKTNNGYRAKETWRESEPGSALYRKMRHI